MPLFNYIAIDKEGKQKEGTLEVGSQNEALSRIKEMGYYPTQVAEVKDTPEEVKKRKKKGKKGEISIALPFVSSKELCQFTRQLAVLIDAGCWWENYPSDMTRTGVFGQPSAEFLAAFDAVEAAVQAAITTFRPGITGREMDHAARVSLTEAGHGNAFLHRLGHGLGLDIHEPPYLASSSSDTLQEGSVFSIEPGVYYPGRFGIRLEDIVHVHNGELEILSSLSRSLIRRG